ncbi:hypothetical protein [Alkaliphilus peptidifermentans]|uniref:Uncharacterized protein n=1 Tax=Alkaliphilus peptidifermentans DSM 18978 TaxID=1120976 RepID=A0A1G5FUV7_9FIRM|nr:hypothetical protein [Alkaliphilus peptidifermentans]SCY43043.1 hypothetical protein SAMN03080606_01501 [Alkaliphilus peptidifermentans DSM 18978]
MQPSVRVGKPIEVGKYNIYNVEGYSIFVNKNLPFNNELMTFVLENTSIEDD